MSGAPVQVQPYVPEPGVPSFTVPTGSPTPPLDTGSGIGASTGTASNVGGSDPLNTMLGTSWGSTAVSNAEALGVNPSALAATCVLESGCQNVGGSGSITGAFQMTSATYTAMINQALADNPSLASSIVPGLAGQSDPATQSIAASEYLSQAAQALQSAGVSNPTVLQARGYYNFGPSGAALATADDSELMSQAMPNVSQTTFSNNGVTPGETVGQWKSAVSAKIGTAANQSVIM
jgi:type II secretory pathway pseudopilin PulG